MERERRDSQNHGRKMSLKDRQEQQKEERKTKRKEEENHWNLS
jgi:hypothetical protein